VTGRLRERVALRLMIFRILPYAGKGVLALAALLQVFTGLAPVAFIVATSAVVGRVPDAVAEGLDSPEWRSLRDALVVAGALFVVQQVLAPLEWAVGELVAWRVDDRLRERAADASFRPPGIAALEDQETLDMLADIADPRRGVGFSPGAGCSGMLFLLARYIQCAVAAAFIGVVYTWWAAVATAAGALALRAGIRSGIGRLGEVEQGFAPDRRRRDYYRSLLTSGGAAKEIRVFGLLDWLRDRYAAHALAAVLPVWKARRRYIYGRYLISAPAWLLLSGAATVGAARAAAGGDLTLGELVYVLQGIVLVGSIGTFMDEADWQIELGLRAYRGLERFEEPGRGRRGAEGGGGDGGPVDGASRRDPLRGRELRLRRRRPPRAARPRPDDPRRALARDRRPERRREDDARQAPRPPLRAAGGTDHRRRHRPALVPGPRLASAPRGDLPGLRALRLLGARQRRLRRAAAPARRRPASLGARARGCPEAGRTAAARPRDDALA